MFGYSLSQAEMNLQPDYNEKFFTAQDGVRLFFRRWFVKEPKGLIGIIHGFAEHSGRYDQLANDLCKANWSVAAFDCRGHGQSGGRRAHVDRFSEYLDDVDSFLDQISQAGYSAAPIMLGHSQGGLIAARFVERSGERVAAVVLSSPFLGMAIKVPKLKALAGKGLSNLVPTLSLKTGLDASCLSHDRKVVEEYEADPLVSNIASARWFTEVLKAQDQVLVQAVKFNRPLLVMQAGDDKLSSVESTRHFFERAQSTDKSLQMYEGYYHEIFNEVERAKVIADLEDWLDQHSQ
jgi:alpha-beta hydrolase superfamily lysophospholipase